MGILRWTKSRGTDAADPGANGNLREQMETLVRENRERRDPALERQILRLRHQEGTRLVARSQGPVEWVEPDRSTRWSDAPIAELPLSDLTPEVLRAAILSRGCLLVRGAVERERALALAEGIDAALRERESGSANGDGLFEEFAPDPPYRLDERHWVNDGGGLWGADSPRLSFEMFETYESAGLPGLIEAYLGEPAAVSVNKCTLRKVDPSAGRGWHQDGAFMGDVRALNVWLSLSSCGEDAPGMDIVPRRLEKIAPTGTEGAIFDWSVSEEVAREIAGDAPIVRPRFEPGDMLFFDEMLLHTTAAEPRMPNPRFAIETWFFGPSRFPEDYVPIAV